jgi:DNA-directed RNA polymerase subunit RPC12/RpoP
MQLEDKFVSQVGISCNCAHRIISKGRPAKPGTTTRLQMHWRVQGRGRQLDVVDPCGYFADGGESIEVESATEAARHAGISVFGYVLRPTTEVIIARSLICLLQFNFMPRRRLTRASCDPRGPQIPSSKWKAILDDLLVGE